MSDADDFGEFEEADDKIGSRVGEEIDLDSLGRPLNALPCVRII